MLYRTPEMSSHSQLKRASARKRSTPLSCTTSNSSISSSALCRTFATAAGPRRCVYTYMHTCIHTYTHTHRWFRRYQLGRRAALRWAFSLRAHHRYAEVSKETYYKAKETYYKAKETYYMAVLDWELRYASVYRPRLGT